MTEYKNGSDVSYHKRLARIANQTLFNHYKLIYK